MPNCHICGTKYEPFISFGKMPIANGFLSEDQFQDEFFYKLQVGACPNCLMVQLVEQPAREMMFHHEYAYFSSTSERQIIHFRKFAEIVMRAHLSSNDPFVVELGSNDGIMLHNFSRAGIRHLGVEPSANVAKVAIEKGVKTTTEFFDELLAEKIIAENGQADAILAANVMCHIPYLHSVVAGMKKLLKPNGVLIFEDPYLGDIIEKSSYDQIYDEHVFYFSLASVSYLFRGHDMEVVDIMPLEVHGGSMRYVIKHKGVVGLSPAVTAQQAKEEALGIHTEKAYNRLNRNIESSRDQLKELLHGLKKRGKRVVGYGATSKSTTVTNYCNIGPDLVEFISDTTPIKQGRFSPGKHIPVQPYEEFCKNYPDYALLFAWNHAKEIMAKEQEFLKSGGRWIMYVPKIRIM